MNEPSVFNGPEVTMPRDAIHPYGNVEHRDGDNTAEWSHLKISIAMVGALALGGQSLVGADIGGFFKHPDAEMVVRWYQLAVIAYPFLRNHAHLETPRREPYTYDDATMNRVKASIQLRYKMLPLWYTLFEEYHSAGHPVVRPLFWDFLDDPETATNEDAVENQIMLGSSVLVHGIGKPMDEQKEANVYLPKGQMGSGGWYDLHTGEYLQAGAHKVSLTLDTIPIYYR